MILKADRIITGDGSAVLENKAVRFTDGKITDIGDPAVLKAKYSGEPVREYNGASIVPGFIDMHAHIGYWHSQTDAKNYNDFRIAFLAADYAKKAFSKGVTTIRDVSSPRNLCASINASAREGYLEVPRILSTDNALCFTGGHAWEESTEVNGPWEIRAAIRDTIKRGAAWIKVMSSHRTNTPEFTQEELNAAVDECHRVGKKVAVHAGTQPAIEMCIDAGFDTIEHGTYLTEDQAKRMVEKGLVWVPTMVAYTQTYEYLEENKGKVLDETGQDFMKHFDYFKNAAIAYRENFGKLYKTGVKIVTGTDVVTNNAPVTPVASELKYMVKYGMPAIEAIKAATKTGAETLCINDITGEIAAGKQADITVLDGNPLQDIGAAEKVREVYFGGKSVYRKE